MLRNCSPDGVNVEAPATDGVVPHDPIRHPAHSGPQAPGTGGAQTWEWHDKDRALVTELADLGMSTRATAPIVGADQATVTRDLGARDANASPDTEPRQIAGRDGKSYTAPSPSEPPKPGGNAPRKFQYLEALRGRVGTGHGQITRPEYVALVMLGTYADADLTGARPGHARLASDCGYTGRHAARTAGDLIRSLIGKGYIVVMHHGTNIVGNVASEYRLTLPEWQN